MEKPYWEGKHYAYISNKKECKYFYRAIRVKRIREF